MKKTQFNFNLFSPVKILPADANSGVVVDGIKVIHGVQRFLPGREAPNIGKARANMVYEVRSMDANVRNSMSFHSNNGLSVNMTSSRSLFLEIKLKRWNFKSLIFSRDQLSQHQHVCISKILTRTSERPGPIWSMRCYSFGANQPRV